MRGLDWRVALVWSTGRENLRTIKRVWNIDDLEEAVEIMGIENDIKKIRNYWRELAAKNKG